MSKVMGATGLGALMERIAGEYRAKGSIYEIPEGAFRKAFELEAGSPGLRVMGGVASLPVGPAAGPHTQIAPNLVAAYLAGARVFELKTVQENDELEIAKPCIDALDEGHNTEWSTELSLVAAREEYLRGWMAVNLLAAIFSSSPGSFFFNMSVGYTLAGIKGAKMDSFIELMRAPSKSEFWKLALRDLETFVESAPFLSAFGAEARLRARALVSDFPASPVHSVTLSTMHGCPPDEIARIASYLIEEKLFDAYVKLNPTLLGFDEARAILDETGWKDIEIDRGLFERDLQFPDALGLVESLDAKARAKGRRFGVKLSNTLANANPGGFLPGGERYMSGRALFPLTVRLAAKLAGELAARVPSWDSRFSYCGGAWALNAGELVAAGLGPITIATDILKPGGYLRLLPAARAAVAALPSSKPRPDPAALSALAEAALASPEYRAGWKSGRARIERPLPLTDCFAAPCVEACPVGQKVPEYIRLGAEGEAEGALAAIRADNPLPFITGTLCDHVCQEVCCRNDYEGSVEIRAVKLECAKAGSLARAGAAPVPIEPAPRNASAKGKVAVIGAGPAGLSCAHHLALAGVPVTVFDSLPAPGGVPANVIPGFRIPRPDIAADIDRIRGLGAEFRLGAPIASLEELEKEGYANFFVCVGAPVARELPLEGEAIPVVDALTFLAAAAALSAGKPGWAFGEIRRVVVAGGGNTAMDAARIALRLPGVEEVRISYRRSRRDMPADAEELRNALEEGAKLMELCLPERSFIGSDGPRLSLRAMRVGPRDASGRNSPVPTDRTESVLCDLVVAAVGERPDEDLLSVLGLSLGPNGLPLYDASTQGTSRPGLYVGGDAARGPSSIISAEADGRRAAYAMLRSWGIEAPRRSYLPPPPDAARLAERGEILGSAFLGSPAAFLSREAHRCLRCDSACLRCVEVCPNRANFALPVETVRGKSGDGDFAQSIQILHVDVLCNECGNCGVFCPYEGEPFKGKPTLFADRTSLEASRNGGFAFGDEGKPSLLVRESPGGATLSLGYSEWSEGRSGMAALARAVYLNHRYLIGGSA